MNGDFGAYADRTIVLEPLAAGMLSGARFAVKDLIDIEGYTPGAGSPKWKQTHKPAAFTAPVITRLLYSGARLAGTTQLDELMFGLNGENDHYGTPLNPKAPLHIPGGSSSGSAAVVAGGLADFAIGSDTAGSIRIPASYCGLYGFRPTHGIVSTAGMVPLAPLFDTVGWFANDAAMLRKIGEVLLPDAACPSPSSHKHGFGQLLVADDMLSFAEQAVVDAFWQIIGGWRELFRQLDRVIAAEEGLARWLSCFRTLQGLEVWRTHREWIETVKPRLGSGTEERFAWAKTLKETDAEPELALRESIKLRMELLLGEDGVIAVPTAPGGALLRNTRGPELEERRRRILHLCCVAGLAGLPQVTLPVMEVNGLPVGVSLIAGQGQDKHLLAAAQMLSSRGV